MPQEVLLTTSSFPDSSILLHDLHNSNHIQSFRQSVTAQNGLAMTVAKTRFLAAQLDRGTVHVYSWGKDTVNTKMILPEKIRSLKVTPSGTWCVGGSETGRLFLWEVASGNLLFAREAHYQPLTQMSFTSDEALLFTGGEDAVIHTWRVMDLVDFNLRSEEIMPVQSWNEHTLTITGIICGNGTAMTARVYTSSLDQTIWDVSTLSLMTTIVFPSAINTFVLDPAERAIYVGTLASIIHQFNLFQSIGGKYEAIGGDPSHPVQAVESAHHDFRGHSTEVTAINLSFDGTLLISGDNSGEIFVWDVGSRQVLRKIKGQNGPISSILTFVKPEDVTLLSGELQQFKRLQNERGRTDHDIWMTIPDQEIVENNIEDAQIAQRGLQMLMDEGSEAKLKSRVIELEDELQRVYGAYGDLKDIHEKLWGKYVDEKMQQE